MSLIVREMATLTQRSTAGHWTASSGWRERHTIHLKNLPGTLFGLYPVEA
jgi:hypothetical protein